MVTKKVKAKTKVVKAEKIKLTLAKSMYGCLPTHKACVLGLGLRRINHTVEVINTPENQGMINKVSYLLKVED